MASGALFEPGTLWPRLVAQTAAAVRRGALARIPTDAELVEQAGVRFVLRVVANLARKPPPAGGPPTIGAAGRDDFDPFLPHDPALFVSEVGPAHLALLNKYNVVDHHLLVVTRQFEEQEALLSGADFTALAACLGQYPSLGFYNAGASAGASQRHKHLQLVPLPLGPAADAVPIEPLLGQAPQDGSVGQSPGLPFLHGYARLPPGWLEACDAAESLLACYRRLLGEVGLLPKRERRPASATRPYNLLVARGWMLLVPRARECVEGISVNALGFAGALLVRCAAEAALVRSVGPLALLRQVALPAA